MSKSILFAVNFEQILHIVFVFLLLTLNERILAGYGDILLKVAVKFKILMIILMVLNPRISSIKLIVLKKDKVNENGHISQV